MSLLLERSTTEASAKCVCAQYLQYYNGICSLNEADLVVALEGLL